MEKRTDNRWDLIGIAWEMGYLIALPLVGLALLGRFLDTAFGTSPLIFILGIIIAIALSTVLVVRKTTDVINGEDSSQCHLERPKNEKISRRDDESV